MIGPQIPAHLLQSKERQEEKEGQGSGERVEDTTIESIGPQFPSQSTTSVQQDQDPAPAPTEEEEDDDDDAYTPALPPDLLEARAARENTEVKPQASGRRRAPIGPMKPAVQSEEEEDDGSIGPTLPSDYNEEEDLKRTIADVESRTLGKPGSKDKDTNSKPQRGEWMLVPPKAGITGSLDPLKPRQFSRRPISADADNSVWTDTPADRERKRLKAEQERTNGKRKREEDTVVSKAVRERDEEMQRLTEEYNAKNRSESLLVMHRVNYAKSGAWKEHDAASRPFDREKDLAPKMSKKRKEEFLSSLGDIGGRFGHGNRGRYL